MLGRMPTFLTTHTGSLPRPTDLTQLLHDRESRKPTPLIEQRISEAVKQAVRQQVEAGVDVVNDGEMGKIGYTPSPPCARALSSRRLGPIGCS
jgi:5-methyltetrahydropteroyltriglutamate--homocysteine methyltransferase